MCGIAGIFGKCSSPEIVKKMVVAMHRRGPDDSGIWSGMNNEISLGHARLSIIDLSNAGHQPMLMAGELNQTLNIDQSAGSPLLSIAFNGEIYNYKELKTELEAKGALFNTNSDTEVILWGWKIWGKDTPRRLRGMFAFAIWDSEKRLLSLVRDRMGIKPLLWYQKDNGLVFASSLKAMLASGEVPRVLNHQGLFDYLLQGAVLQPRTIIRDVQSLPPGSIISFTLSRENEIQVEKHQFYWALGRVDTLAEELAKKTYQDQVNLTRHKIEEACKYHLVADVQVGSFLSGGVDSTVITALMSRFSSYPIKSFSIGYASDTGMKNELTEARMAANYIGCDHTEVILTGKEVADYFDDFIDILDQPSVDGLNTYWVSKIASENGVKVALSGLGADELFAGYGAFGWYRKSEQIKASFTDNIKLLIHRSYPSRLTIEGARRGMSFSEMVSTSRCQMNESGLMASVNRDILKSFNHGHLFNYIDNLNLSNQDKFIQYTEYECRNYLLNTLLRDADAASMGHSLEVRPIFLDHHLVEHAFALPETSKWRNNIPKSILKDATADLMPQDFFKREKTGFTLPINYWIENELHQHYLNVINSNGAAKLFSPEMILNLSNRKNIRNKWLFLVLLSWIEKEKVEFDV
jgi:asparagine synthase (glutamine-hydrolysing)